jgi:hypothetical protein
VIIVRATEREGVMALIKLSTMSKKEIQNLSRDMHQRQDKKCFICEEEVNLQKKTEIVHIIPLMQQGKNIEENLALTHKECYQAKLDNNLNIAKVLHKLSVIEKKAVEKKEKVSLEHVLSYFSGSKFDFNYKITKDILSYNFHELGHKDEYHATIFCDPLAGEKSCFIEIPIEYLFHDQLINPRSLNFNAPNLIREFHKGNPQLQLGLVRIDQGKLKVFDGQHKAVAQILLGARVVLFRVFVEPDVSKLIETNTNAGSMLRQIEFDESTVYQLNTSLHEERLKQDKNDKKLNQFSMTPFQNG